MLEAKSISVSYGHHRALQDASLSVGEGEIVVILGANGAGKTTLLKAISGLVPMAPGAEVAIDGVSLHALKPHEIVEAGVTLVPEGRGLFGELTVEENLGLGAFAQRARATERAALTHVYSLFPALKERRHQMARTMSGGEQQMVAIGRALMSAPKILMLDEPSLGLAPVLCTQLFRALERIGNDGTGILLVEQDANQSLAIADRGYLIENGHMSGASSAADLRSDPAVQAAYLGVAAPAPAIRPTGPTPAAAVATVEGRYADITEQLKVLRGKAIVVTGVSSGIGAMTARALKRSGARVIGVDVYESHDHIDQFVKADFTEKRSIDRAVEEIPGAVDGLAAMADLPADMPAEAVIKVNYVGQRYFAEQIAERLSEGAAVVHLSAPIDTDWRNADMTIEQVAGIEFETVADFCAAHGIAGRRGYEFSKAAMAATAFESRERWQARGVRLNIVSPTNGALARGNGADAHPLINGHEPTAPDPAHVIAYLLSESAALINGANIPLSAPEGGVPAPAPTQMQDEQIQHTREGTMNVAVGQLHIGYEPRGHYIGGEWVRPRATFEDLNPSTGEVYCEAPDANRIDVANAVDAADAAFKEWSNLPHTARADFMLKIADAYMKRQDEIVRHITSEGGGWFGKGMFETGYVHGVWRAAAAACYEEVGEILPSDHLKVSLAVRRPMGVISVVSPWNFPMILTSRGMAFALAAGNTVVLKPSEETPVIGGLLFAEIFEEAGVPPGVLNVVTCSRDAVAEVGDEMVSNPKVKGVSFTGSTAVGRKIAAQAGGLLKECCIEAGGKNALIVFDDADIDRALQAANFGAFMHQGQICMSIDRVLVQDSILDEFTRRFVEKAATLKKGDPGVDKAHVIGPIINERQVGRIKDQLDDAVEKGAQVLLGGRVDGLYVEPTILTGVTDAMKIYREETFGPVTSIYPFSSEEDAVRIANDSDYGLSAGVMTRDEERGLKIAGELETGMCHINCSPVNDEAMVPFGGAKGSGSGRHGGKWALSTFTETRWITLERGHRHYPPVF